MGKGVAIMPFYLLTPIRPDSQQSLSARRNL